MRIVVAILLLTACAANEQVPDDPVRHKERGLRQSPENGEGLGDDRCEGEGCPEPDTDGDGIKDNADACPEEADTDPVDRAFDGCPEPAADP